jgi:glycosyltransferase involved in cell wall biosynthesis
MKKISVTIPCYNDSHSIRQMYQRLTKVFAGPLAGYDYEIIYVDDCSPDGGKTWAEIAVVCAADRRVKGVRNARNFGFYRNVFATLTYGSGDACFMLFGDLQDPPEYLPEFVKHWEAGAKVTVGQRSNSYSSPVVRLGRCVYYKMLARFSNNRQIAGISGFGLYDRSFVRILDDIEDIQPILTGIITEYVRDVKIVPVVQEAGGRGKSNLNFWGKYDGAMMSITSYTKTLLRMITFIGGIAGALSVLYGLFIVIYKLVNWNTFSSGMPSLIAGMFFLGAVQLFFLGIIGEYILSINNRSMKRPLVVVDERINFEAGPEQPQTREQTQAEEETQARE